MQESVAGNHQLSERAAFAGVEGEPGVVPANPTCNFIRKVSAYMAKHSTPTLAVSQLVEVIASPGETMNQVTIGLGGILVFKNGSEMPDFVIEFVQPGPPGTSSPLTGTTSKPISVQMPEDDARFTEDPNFDHTYTYQIRFMKKGQAPVLEGPLRVRYCQVCS